MVDHILGDGLIVAVLVVWWLYSASVPEYIFPSPLVVGAALYNLISDPELALHILASVTRITVAVIAAMAVGGALALTAYYWPVTREIVHGRIKPFLQSVPPIGWALLAIVWFKISNSTVIFVEFIVLVPICLVNLSEGLRAMDREVLEMSESFTRSTRKTFSKIMWPLLYPFAIAAMRMSYGIGLKVALVAEVFGAKIGVGYLMYQAQETADTPMVFATCLTLVGLFAAGDRFIFEPLSGLYRGNALAASSDNGRS